MERSAEPTLSYEDLQRRTKQFALRHYFCFSGEGKTEQSLIQFAVT